MVRFKNANKTQPKRETHQKRTKIQPNAQTENPKIGQEKRKIFYFFPKKRPNFRTDRARNGKLELKLRTDRTRNGKFELKLRTKIRELKGSVWLVSAENPDGDSLEFFLY